MFQEARMQPAPAPDPLASERTYLAHERTLMAWTRMATSLITFGFTLYKFFEFLHESGQAPHRHLLIEARIFGLTMIGVGVFTLVAATLQHRSRMRRLSAAY